MDTAVEVMLSNREADDEKIFALLLDRGFKPLEAWRACRFVPIGFVHVVCKGTGVTFQPKYIVMDAENSTGNTLPLAEETFYTEAVESAEARLAEGGTPQQLLSVFGRSAEWNVIQQLAKPEGRLDGVVLTEPVLSGFDNAVN